MQNRQVTEFASEDHANTVEGDIRASRKKPADRADHFMDRIMTTRVMKGYSESRSLAAQRCYRSRVLEEAQFPNWLPGREKPFAQPGNDVLGKNFNLSSSR
jgi:hypothetical protein